MSLPTTNIYKYWVLHNNVFSVNLSPKTIQIMS